MTIDSAIASVRFRVTFTEVEIDALVKGAETHYDAVCRHYGLVQRLKLYKEKGTPLDVSVDWHDLDILSKICESPRVDQKVASDVWMTFARLREVSTMIQGWMDQGKK